MALINASSIGFSVVSICGAAARITVRKAKDIRNNTSAITTRSRSMAKAATSSASKLVNTRPLGFCGVL